MPLVQGAFLIVIILFLVLFFYFVPLGMWVQAVVSLGLGRIRIVDLIRMRLRKISPRLVVDGVINTHKAGLDHISTDMLETHYLAGGNVENISYFTSIFKWFPIYFFWPNLISIKFTKRSFYLHFFVSEKF